MTVRLFEDANALDSLRNSDFDALSAYGEVIDNSIQAGAKTVHIRFVTEEGRAGYRHIQRVLFGDDGHGMDADTLHKCLKIGWSSRYNQRGGIGRFGVGMTMAAIHECKRVDVYSRHEGGPWLRTYIDLDEVANGKMGEIPIPAPVTLPAEYNGMVGEGAGTLVVWSKYDRQTESASTIVRDAEVWLGRTYRYFIWDDDVRIFLDGGEVPAHDPLYYRTEKTRFPDDPQSELFDDIVFSYPVDTHDTPPGTPAESPIRIRLSLLPEAFRPEQGSGNFPEARARLIQDNEGVSILRNRREVFYGSIPYWKAAGSGWPQWDDKDRWWGGEIHFDAVLDRAFTVKNIKRGADPVPELKRMIKAQIQPTRQSCIDKVDELWKKAKARKRIEASIKATDSVIPRPEIHLIAEDVARRTPTDQHEIDREKDFNKEVDNYLERSKRAVSEAERAAYKAMFASQPFTIMEGSWRGPYFFDSTHLGGKSILEYNITHPFFEKVYGAIQSLEEDADPHQVSRDLKAMLDLLLIAYAKSEAKFAPDADMSAEQFIEAIRSNWGQYLQSYLRTWEKERAGDDA